MLDTDSVSYALRGRGRVAARLVDHPPSAVCMSSLTLAELRFGAEHKNSARLQLLISGFVGDVRVVPFDQAAADAFGRTYSLLLRLGQPIGQLDTMIAAHALALDVTLVTNNERHFGRVPGLRIENWV